MPSYYLRYFYSHDVVLEEQLHAPTRAEAVMETERALLAKYADASVVTKPAELEQRGGAYYSEAAIDVLSSILGDRGDVQVLNVRNDGTFPFLPDDHVIEVPARVTRQAITPLPVAPLDPDMVGLVSAVPGTNASRSTPRCTAVATGCSGRCGRTRSSGRSTRRSG